MLSPEGLLNFLSKFYIPTCVGKFFKFKKFTFLENALIQGIFTHAPRQSKLTTKFLSSRPRQKEITHSPRQHSFEDLFSSTAETGGENQDLLIEIQPENMKMTWNIRSFTFCMIYNFFICDSFTVS